MGPVFCGGPPSPLPPVLNSARHCFSAALSLKAEGGGAAGGRLEAGLGARQVGGIGGPDGAVGSIGTGARVSS